MPSFHVTGFHRQTHAEVDRTIEAADEHAAVRACDFIVASVERVEPVPKPSVTAAPADRVLIPEYSGLLGVGHVMRVAGLFIIVPSAIAAVVLIAELSTETGPTKMAGAVAGVVLGIFIVAGGEACHALRDIARNSFR